MAVNFYVWFSIKLRIVCDKYSVVFQDNCFVNHNSKNISYELFSMNSEWDLIFPNKWERF